MYVINFSFNLITLELSWFIYFLQLLVNCSLVTFFFAKIKTKVLPFYFYLFAFLLLVLVLLLQMYRVIKL
jgi:hypothetical protein